MSFNNPESSQLMNLDVISTGREGAASAPQAAATSSTAPPQVSGVWHWQPGDIVLFNKEKGKVIDVIISHLTRCEWTHSLIICSGLPPPIASGNFAAATPESEDGTDGLYWTTASGERLFLFESACLEPPVWDFLTGRKRCGIRVVDAYQRITSACLEEGRRVVVRRIHPFNPKIVAAISTVQKKLANGKYDWNPLTLTEPLAGPGRDDPELAAVLEQRRRVFCSQLVADVLIEAGILPRGRAARTYSPRDFWTGGSAEADMASLGYAMSEPVSLRF
jgi:hypothetical protein